jgi:hypothetical protein
LNRQLLSIDKPADDEFDAKPTTKMVDKPAAKPSTAKSAAEFSAVKKATKPDTKQADRPIIDFPAFFLVIVDSIVPTTLYSDHLWSA